VQVRASERGYARALCLAEREAPGRRAWAIEGTGSYGAGLARFLTARGERVLLPSYTRARDYQIALRPAWSA
jgi:transposase